MKKNSQIRLRSTQFFCSALSWVAIVSGSHAYAATSTQTTETFDIRTVESLLREAAPIPIERLFEQAQTLQNQQAWAQVLELLYPQEVHHAGNVAFDTLLGLAASHMGELTRAILAYERVLDAEPDNTQVKAAMAALYFRTGENREAKALFDSLSALSLPPNLAHNIDQYLRALDERMRRPKSGWTLWTSWSAGYDSNVNNGTDLSAITVPGSAPIKLEPGNALRRKSSAMTSGLIGLRWSQHIDAPSTALHRCRFVAEASVNQIKYATLPDLSSQTLVADSALNCPFVDPRKQWQIGLQARNEKSGQKTVRHTQTLRGQYYLTLQDAAQISTNVQLGRLEHPQDRLRDGHRYQADIDWMTRLGSQENWLLGTGLGLAHERVTETTRKYQGYRSIDWHAYARYNMTRYTALQLYVSNQKRRYQGADPLFSTQRRDSQWLWSVALNWTPDSRYSSQWTASLTHQYNTSSHEVFSFRRLTPTLSWSAAF